MYMLYIAMGQIFVLVWILENWSGGQRGYTPTLVFLLCLRLRLILGKVYKCMLPHSDVTNCNIFSLTDRLSLLTQNTLFPQIIPISSSNHGSPPEGLHGHPARSLVACFRCFSLTFLLFSHFSLLLSILRFCVRFSSISTFSFSLFQF